MAAALTIAKMLFLPSPKMSLIIPSLHYDDNELEAAFADRKRSLSRRAIVVHFFCYGMLLFSRQLIFISESEDWWRLLKLHTPLGQQFLLSCCVTFTVMALGIYCSLLARSGSRCRSPQMLYYVCLTPLCMVIHSDVFRQEVMDLLPFQESVEPCTYCMIVVSACFLHVFFFDIVRMLPSFAIFGQWVLPWLVFGSNTSKLAAYMQHPFTVYRMLTIATLGSWIIVTVFVHEKEQRRTFRLEEEDRRRQKQREMVYAKTSHELKTNIHLISLRKELLGETLTSSDRPVPRSTLSKAMKDIHSIQLETEDLKTTVLGILEFARARDRKEPVSNAVVGGGVLTFFSPVNLYRALVDKLSLLAACNGNKLSMGVEMCGWDGDFPDVTEESVMVYGDATMFLVVGRNYITNSIKYCADGVIDLTLKVVLLSCGDEGDGDAKKMTVRVDMEVKDTGIGIPKDKLKSVFQPYVQAGGVTSKTFSTHGLGLSTVQDVAQSLTNGRVWADSDGPGTGASFHFTAEYQAQLKQLPPTLGAVEECDSEEQREETASKSLSVQGASSEEQKDSSGTICDVNSSVSSGRDISGRHVLLVDDMPFILSMQSSFLATQGVKKDNIFTALDGISALESVRDKMLSEGRLFDLILTDLEMPKLNGIDFAKRVHMAFCELAADESPLPKTPVTGIIWPAGVSSGSTLTVPSLEMLTPTTPPSSTRTLLDDDKSHSQSHLGESPLDQLIGKLIINLTDEEQQQETGGVTTLFEYQLPLVLVSGASKSELEEIESTGLSARVVEKGGVNQIKDLVRDMLT
ncbi:unnamed protein product [Vitrella brassicaformis CCMP3155]|uniref:histidine kinase n=1 Tax=Vitrella brassicaformis (strain CCMP3155) TaxID=1169540 RepID=A0A0G4FP55_VITBC|nr:unnamed protein product [Vitrella brassicaformis CCMP3155]|eukprot:CEM16017.1 unnamed protein product [Vitrella brassicaformis CCMP3155]